jgi:hypothetical protein
MYFTYAVRPNTFTIGVALTLFLFACLGTVTPVFYYLNLRFVAEETILAHPKRPLREAFLLTAVVVACAILQISGLMSWVFVLFLTGLAVAAEIALINWFD